jgi:2-dehydro-3-deoxyphosphogluconate aldolase/(4S)-4-hydroxy-2-oxoglutarate aldolase
MVRFSTGDLHKRLYTSGVIAVLIIDDAHDAVPLARALYAGGVDCIELTLRTNSALDSVKRIAQDVPEVVVGVGTILSQQQADAAKEAGADFGVAPGMNPRVVQHAIQIGLPFSPGVCTPTDIEMALELGCRVLKFFPSEPSGGLSYLKSAAAPYMHLGVKYIPLGGVSAKNAEDYLRDSNVMALGGSWLGPRDLIQKKDWTSITKLASEATEIVKRVRGAQG